MAMMRHAIIVALAVTGCSKSFTSSTASGVSVELAGVTLADECGDSGPPPKPPGIVAKRAPVGQDKVDAMEPPCHGSDCRQAHAAACDQTSMQLAMRSSASAAMTIHIKQVELLDSGGKVLEVLTARKPSKWADDGSYVSWDETVAANQTLAASYSLSSPSWDKIAEGRVKAHTKVFALRVTVTVGNAETTVEKQSIQPVMLEAPVET